MTPLPMDCLERPIVEMCSRLASLQPRTDRSERSSHRDVKEYTASQNGVAGALAGEVPVVDRLSSDDFTIGTGLSPAPPAGGGRSR